MSCVNSENLTNCPQFLERCEKGVNCYSHADFLLVPKLVTLNDREPRHDRFCVSSNDVIRSEAGSTCIYTVSQKTRQILTDGLTSVSVIRRQSKNRL